MILRGINKGLHMNAVSSLFDSLVSREDSTGPDGHFPGFPDLKSTPKQRLGIGMSVLQKKDLANIVLGGGAHGWLVRPQRFLFDTSIESRLFGLELAAIAEKVFEGG